MLTITLMPTTLVFKDLTDGTANKLHNEIGLKWHYKGYYYIDGTESELFKALLKLSYTYDIEIV